MKLFAAHNSADDDGREFDGNW